MAMRAALAAKGHTVLNLDMPVMNREVPFPG